MPTPKELLQKMTDKLKKHVDLPAEKIDRMKLTQEAAKKISEVVKKQKG